MRHCLSEENTLKLIMTKLGYMCFDADDHELSAICEEAEEWQQEIIIFNYFISKILERSIKKGGSPDLLLRDIMKLTESMFISYQAFDRDFIDVMMNNTRVMGTTLAENIIIIQDRLSSHVYR